MTEPTAPKKSDLGVRTLSAIVMVAVAGTALWLGNAWLDGFILVIAALGGLEMVRLVLKAWTGLAARISALLFGLSYLAAATWSLLISEPVQLVQIVLMVIAIDVFAYFFGRTLGGPKVAPSISPSKTWAGLLGAMIGGALLWNLQIRWFHGSSFAGQYAEGFYDFSFELNAFTTSFIWFKLFMTFHGALFGIVAQAGDFLESWVKRRAGLKDSSNLIPGHGGVLDRVDGLLAAAVFNLLPTAWIYIALAEAARNIQ